MKEASWHFKSNLNRKVAINIIKAQVASDNAKGIYELYYDGDIINNYDGKDIYILRAIETIIKKKNTGFSFYVTKDNSINSYLVYFDFDILDNHYQVSFHSYNYYLEKYLGKKKHFTTCDRGSSRLNCKLLAEVI